MHPIAVLLALAAGGFALSRVAQHTTAPAPAPGAPQWHPLYPDPQGFYDVPNGATFALSMPVADSPDGTNASSTMDADLHRLQDSKGMSGLSTAGPSLQQFPSSASASFPIQLEAEQLSVNRGQGQDAAANSPANRYRAMATSTNLNLILQSHDPQVAPLLVWYWG